MEDFSWMSKIYIKSEYFILKKIFKKSAHKGLEFLIALKMKNYEIFIWPALIFQIC